jgi:hypothetical protein
LVFENREKAGKKGETTMDRTRTNTQATDIFENVIFLAEVFGDKADKDIPKIPVLEMAQCFQLSRPPLSDRYRRRRRDWPLWK